MNTLTVDIKVTARENDLTSTEVEAFFVELNKYTALRALTIASQDGTYLKLQASIKAESTTGLSTRRGRNLTQRVERAVLAAQIDGKGYGWSILGN